MACLVCMMGAACSNNNAPTNSNTTSADTTSFYPIASYFNDQLKRFDSAGAIYNIVTTEGTKKDSIIVKFESIRSLAQSFIDADISDSIQKKNYKESVFRDAETTSFNINYTPISASVTVKNIDILMDENTSLVKRIFIRKQHLNKDTTCTEQLSWKTNEGFTTSISKETNNGFLLNKTIVVRVIHP